MFAIVNPSQDGTSLHRVAKMNKNQTKWIPTMDTDTQKWDTQMNMAICYYMDDLIRYKNQIGDWSDNDLTIRCIKPVISWPNLLDKNDHPPLPVHLQMWKESSGRKDDQECYYSLVIREGKDKDGIAKIQLLVYLMTGNRQGPCAQLVGVGAGGHSRVLVQQYYHLRWRRCLDRVRALLAEEAEIPKDPGGDLAKKQLRQLRQLRRAQLDDPGMYPPFLANSWLFDIWYPSDNLATLDEVIQGYPSERSPRQRDRKRTWLHTPTPTHQHNFPSARASG